MSHRYKLASILLSAGLVMAACGNAGENNESDESSEGSGQSTEQTSSEESSDDESKDDSEANKDKEGDSDEDTSNDSGDGEENNTSDDNAGGNTNNSSTDAITQDDINHDTQGAVEAAKENFDGKLTQIELDQDNGQWMYKVDLEQNTEEYEVELSIEDLSVINESSETDEDEDSEDQFEYGDAVPAEEAVQTAIDEAGGSGLIEEWSLDKDDGNLEYEIELKNTDNGDADIKINAESGDVIETDFDNNNEDDDD